MLFKVNRLIRVLCAVTKSWKKRYWHSFWCFRSTINELTRVCSVSAKVPRVLWRHFKVCDTMRNEAATHLSQNHCNNDEPLVSAEATSSNQLCPNRTFVFFEFPTHIQY